MGNIFQRRESYKPFEYPEVMEFIEAINKSYWVHSEIDFTADLQDYKTKLSTMEQNTIDRALLFISQTEVAVKSFWGKLYDYFPKPEINGLGSTFSESEFRHSEAYSRLLSVMGKEHKFTPFVEEAIVKERLELLKRFLSGVEAIDSRLFFFTIIVENSSLFTQFATILSFTRFKGLMKNVSNIIAWTSVDEQIHANAGIWLLNQIKKENVNLSNLDSTFAASLKEIVEYEDKVVDYIYQEGELPFFTVQNLKDFMRYRIDVALKALNMPTVFNITAEQYRPMKWFQEEVFAGSLDDFFAKRPVDYTKHDKPVSADDLF